MGERLRAILAPGDDEELGAGVLGLVRHLS